MNRPRSDIWLVFTREFNDILKDKKTIFLTVVLPLAIYPLIMFGMSTMQRFQEKKLSESTIVVAVTGGGEWLKPYLAAEDSHIKLTGELKDPESLLKRNAIQIWIDFKTSAEDGSALALIYYSAADELSINSLKTIIKIMEKGRGAYVEKRILNFALRYRVNEVVQTDLVDVSSDRDKSGYLSSRIVPFLMILMILSGASFVAIDLISGEKERGTLETLLLTPVSRRSIVWGKFGVVFVIAVISAVVNLIGVTLTLALNVLDLPLMREVKFQIGLNDLGVILLLTIPLAVFFSALLMIVASYADSFKEGQYYVLPLTFLSMAPGVVTLLPGIELNSLMCVVPVASLALATKEVLQGIYHWPALLIAFAANTFYAAIILRIAARVLDRERILPGARSPKQLGQQGMVKQAFYLFATSWLLLYFGGSMLQKDNIIIGLWLTEILLIALPAVVVVFYFRLPFRSFTRIKSFSLTQMLGAVFLEIATLLGVIPLMTLQNKLLPFPKSFSEEFSQLFSNTGQPAWVTALTFGLSAGICEELLFRGVLTRMLSITLSRTKVILIVGLLFGLFHFNIYRMPVTSVIGFVFTYICLKMDSLIPTMILHTLHNASAVSFGPDWSNFLEQHMTTLPGILIIITLFVIGWALMKLGAREAKP